MRRRHWLMAVIGVVLVGVYSTVTWREPVVLRSSGAPPPARRFATPTARPNTWVSPRTVHEGVVAPSYQNNESDILKVADGFIQRQIEDQKIRKEHQVRGQVFRTPFGSAVKYTVFQGDIPVVGMHIEVRLDLKLSITKVVWNYYPIDSVEIERSGRETYDRLTAQLPAGYLLRKDEPGFSEIIYVVQPHAIGEHSVVVSVLNEHKQPMRIILRARDARLLAAEAPRREVVRRYGHRPVPRNDY